MITRVPDKRAQASSQIEKSPLEGCRAKRHFLKDAGSSYQLRTRRREQLKVWRETGRYRRSQDSISHRQRAALCEETLRSKNQPLNLPRIAGCQGCGKPKVPSQHLVALWRGAASYQFPSVFSPCPTLVFTQSCKQCRHPRACRPAFAGGSPPQLSSPPGQRGSNQVPAPGVCRRLLRPGFAAGQNFVLFPEALAPQSS
jgi:hypothetical protein